MKFTRCLLSLTTLADMIDRVRTRAWTSRQHCPLLNSIPHRLQCFLGGGVLFGTLPGATAAQLVLVQLSRAERVWTVYPKGEFRQLLGSAGDVIAMEAIDLDGYDGARRAWNSDRGLRW